MKNLLPIAIVALVTCSPAAAEGTDVRDSLRPQNIRSVQITLNSGGAQLGFETELSGGDPRILALVAVIREAETRGGHKCPNAGAIRFRMEDGSVVGVGLLPSHTAGAYELRLYDGDEYLTAYRVDRAALLAALEQIGVPTDDYAFRE